VAAVEVFLWMSKKTSMTINEFKEKILETCFQTLLGGFPRKKRKKGLRNKALSPHNTDAFQGKNVEGGKTIWPPGDRSMIRKRTNRYRATPSRVPKN